MRNLSLFSLSIILLVLISGNMLYGQNPLIMDQFTADPSARVFDGRVYVYPSHDIPCGEGQGMIGFCMADYHVFSSENLTDWTDHGVIVSQNKVPWVDSTKFSMWAPDCIYRNGNYYFYFPAILNENEGKGMGVGVAVSDKPYGHFIPEAKPIQGVGGIDPNPFIDKDGQAYLYWAGMRSISMAKLKNNMKELESEVKLIEGLPEGMKEGPYMFERNGIYYLTYPHVADSVERLEYSIADNPMGPFEYVGVIMDESTVGCWTNHQSIIEYKDQWYLFYHHNDLSPDFDKNRSIRADSLFFNDDGTIQKVIPTWRGVGLTNAEKKIQIDRYSAISDKGTSIKFIKDENKHEGWKAILNSDQAWIQYNSVDFGNKNWKSVNVKTQSSELFKLEIRLDKIDGQLLAKVDLGKIQDWNIVNSALLEIPSGIHNLFVVLSGGSAEIDWISFE